MSEDNLTILKGSEVPIDGLLGKSVLLVGYGNQGEAHAKNIKESGIDVEGEEFCLDFVQMRLLPVPSV